jgi:hypothetical protein
MVSSRISSLLGNGCSYEPNFRHPEFLIRITEKTFLLLAPKDKLVTLKILDRKFYVDLLTRKDLTEFSGHCGINGN